MRAIVLPLLLLPLALSASAPAQVPGEPLDAELARARTEQAAADRETARLDRLAQSARNDADRIRAEELAAAQAIDAAEARITASDAQLRLADAYVAAHRERLAREQQPASALLAGLAVMASRPPLLALADRGSTDDLVAVRILLASTLPAIRARTGRLSMELAEGERLHQVALKARADLNASRDALLGKRQRFAQLEQRAQREALATTGLALSAGDASLAAGEDVDRLRGAEANGQAIRNIARGLAAAEAAPPRPAPGEGREQSPPFAYALPVSAAVTEGLGAVSASGVRARGVSLATARGVEIGAPAQGIVRFAGPYRGYDGVLIIDHGGGWLTLLVNLASSLKPGDRVAPGDPVGRALGPIEVELSHNGQHLSPALIAGSSATLSKR